MKNYFLDRANQKNEASPEQRGICLKSTSGHTIQLTDEIYGVKTSERYVEMKSYYPATCARVDDWKKVCEESQRKEFVENGYVKKKFRWAFIALDEAGNVIFEGLASVSGRPNCTFEETTVTADDQVYKIPGKAHWNKIQATIFDFDPTCLGLKDSELRNRRIFISPEKTASIKEVEMRLLDMGGNELEHWKLSNVVVECSELGDGDVNARRSMTLTLEYGAASYSPTLPPWN